MKSWILFSSLFYFIFSPLFAEPSPNAGSRDLSDVFSVSSTPGEGTLTYSQGTESESITLGADSGLYGLALSLKGSWFPAPLRKDFDKSNLIQIALGRLKSKLNGKIPQFGMATLISPQMPKDATAFHFVAPNQKAKTDQPRAVLYFTSPQSSLSQGDQTKLQSTFFGKKGGIIVTPMGESEQVFVPTQNGRVAFKKQKMKFEFQTVLATPFNDQEKKLTGTVIFPVFTAHGKGAEDLAMRLGGALEEYSNLPPKKLVPARKLTGSQENSVPNSAPRR
jgi:hypothetical protein